MPIVYTKKNKTFTLPAPQARFTTRMPICGRFGGRTKAWRTFSPAHTRLAFARWLPCTIP